MNYRKSYLRSRPLLIRSSHHSHMRTVTRSPLLLRAPVHRLKVVFAEVVIPRRDPADKGLDAPLAEKGVVYHYVPDVVLAPGGGVSIVLLVRHAFRI